MTEIYSRSRIIQCGVYHRSFELSHAMRLGCEHESQPGQFADLSGPIVVLYREIYRHHTLKQMFDNLSFDKVFER